MRLRGSSELVAASMPDAPSVFISTQLILQGLKVPSSCEAAPGKHGLGQLLLVYAITSLSSDSSKPAGACRPPTGFTARILPLGGDNPPELAKQAVQFWMGNAAVRPPLPGTNCLQGPHRKR